MTVESIMSYRLLKLKPTDSVCDALRLMHQHHIRVLPVVDDADQLLGLFSVLRLCGLLLPKAAQIRQGIRDLSFMPDELGMLNERLSEVAGRPVADYLDKGKNLTFCKPSTSFPEVMQLLIQRTDACLPVIVVEGEKNKVVGMVSALDVLDRLILTLGDIDTVCPIPVATSSAGEER